ncbi:MAG: hypothetical protein Q7S37_00225 [bacterium]|nr:hypothetical protein [bacterium]
MDEALNYSQPDSPINVNEPTTPAQTEDDFDTDKFLLHRKRKKLIILAVVAVIILIPILIFFLRPKEDIIYQRYEEFGPCLTGNENCYQKLVIHQSGLVVYEGKENKQIQISDKGIRKIKSIINNSQIMETNCQEPPILMAYKSTHTLSINGARKVIEAPGCENEFDVLDLSIEKLLK